MLINSAATLFTRHIVDRQEVWHKTILPGVHWENVKAVNVIKSGMLQADSANVWIPLSECNRDLHIQAEDVLVKGEVSEELGPDFTVSDLRNKYKFMFKIFSVDWYDYGTDLDHILASGS